MKAEDASPGETAKQRRCSLQDFLSNQMERRMGLDNQLRRDRAKVNKLRLEVADLEDDVRTKELLRLGPYEDRRQLKVNMANAKSELEDKIRQLQQSCDKMADEVTKLTEGNVPLGETSFAFYDELTEKFRRLSSHNGDVNGESPRETPMANDNNNTNGQGQGQAEGPQWSCTECTFLNHPALDRCEECEMPRITLGTSRQRQHAPGPCFCHPQDTTNANVNLKNQ